MSMTGFIGAGKMAEAIVRGILRGGVLASTDVGIYDIQPSRVAELAGQVGVRPFASNVDIVKACDVIVLAVKPQDLDAVLSEIAGVAAGRCFMSIAAGRMVKGLEAALPGARVVRVMPNLACQVGAGMSVICGGSLATKDDLATARRLFEASGIVCEAPESHFDIVTAVSGSGPAFWTQLAEYQYKKAVSAGLTMDTARLLILQTMLGTAKILQETNQDFGSFMDAVASKGGTTAAGLDVLRNSEAASILTAVLDATAARSEALRR